jgi:hypothetical protein
VFGGVLQSKVLSTGGAFCCNVSLTTNM